MGAVVFLILGRGGKWVFADHLSKAFLFFALLLIFHRRSVWRVFRHPACAGAFGLGIWYLVAGLLSSSPIAAWSGVSGLWSILVLAVVGASTWGEFDRRFLEWLFAAVVSLQTILLIVGRSFGGNQILLFPGNPQYASFWSCAVVFLALARAFPFRGSTSSSLTRWIWASVSFFGVLGVFLLPVRSGILALFVGSLVFGFARFGRRGLIGVGFVLVIGFSFLNPLQLGQRLKLNDPRSFKRVDIWRATLSGLMERPLFGWGPGQFENLYWRHGLPQEEEPVRFEMTTDRAHNDLLQYFAESGILGGLFALFAFLGIWVSDPKGNRGPGLRAAWAGMGTFAMVNAPLVLPACGALVACLVALALPGRLARRPLFSFQSRRWMIPLGGAFIGLLGLGEVALAINEQLGPHRFVLLDSTSPSQVENRRERANQKIHSGIWNEDRAGENELRDLLRWAPQRAELWRDVGHLEAEHRPPSRMNDALSDFRRALMLSPHKAPWWVETAQVLARGGEFKSARRALAEAIRYEPRYFDAWLGYGVLLRLEGRPADALNWFRTLQEQSVSWPTAQSGDSGYRQTILHRDEKSLERNLKELIS